MQRPTQNSGSISERLFDWLERVLRERKDPGAIFQKISRCFRWGLIAATLLYFGFVLVLFFLLGWQGERNWVLSILLFMPPAIWLIPLVLLTPLHGMICPKLCWVTVATLLVLALVHLDFNWSFFKTDNSRGLTVLTNNVGGRDFNALKDFVAQENPDIIALQDTWSVGNLKTQYPERFIAKAGEYALVSRIPIRKSGSLSNLTYLGRPVGAWFELQYEDQTIVVYNIHMPTPRHEFLNLRGHGLFVELIGGRGIYSGDVRREYQKFVQQKLELARQFVEVLQKEERPFLVAGDFNMPSNGYAWGLFSSRFTDAFATKGRGYGFTFPGRTGGLMNVFGSWLRIDYLFAKKNWQVNWCRVEPRSEAEHRAVLARFELKEELHKP